MKKLLSGLFSLILFLGVGATGVGYYINGKSTEFAEQTISFLKQNGFDLSQYDSLEIDYFEQSATLKNLKVASSDQIWLKLAVDEVKLEGINPIGGFYAQKTQFSNVNLTYYGQVYEVSNVVATGLQTSYQPHFERLLAEVNIAEKIQIFHEELNYDGLAFSELKLSDNLDNVSRITDGSYSKLALLNNLPSQWRAHFTGVELSQAHIPAQYAQWLRTYNLKDLNGILDVSFDYQANSRTAVFAINNLNFGGLANLQSDILFSMTDERFNSIYDIDNLELNLSSLPIEHAEILYNDYGLYSHFVAQQAKLLGTNDTLLNFQLKLGVALAASEVSNTERRSQIFNPITSFIDKPAGLKMEFSPAKPVRFQQYLNVYDADILVRDLNPHIEYLSE